MGERRAAIGVIINELNDDYQLEILRGIEDSSAVRGNNLIIFVGRSVYSRREYSVHYDILHHFLTRNNIDGLILMSGSMTDKFYTHEQLQRYCRSLNNLPLASVGEKIEEGGCSILVDNEIGMASIVDHLIMTHGYRRIAYIGGPEGNQDADERFRAYKSVLAGAGIPYDESYVYHCRTFERLEGERAVKVLYKERKLEPEAIVAADDELALGAVGILKKMGKVVGRDVAVTGFDWAGEARYLTPSLTTVKQPLYELGHKAVETLHELIEERQRAGGVIKLQTEFKYGRSCGCSQPLVSRHYKFTSELRRALLERQEQIRHPLFECGGEERGVAGIDIEQWRRELTTALIEDMKYESEESVFLKTVNSIVLYIMEKRNSYMQMMLTFKEVIDCLKLSVIEQLNHLVSHKELEELTRLFENGHIIILQLMKRRDDSLKNKTRLDFYFIQRIYSRLISEFSLDNLKKVITDYLPELGIKYCYLVLYSNLKLSTIFSETPVTVVGYGTNKGELRPVNSEFSANPYLINEIIDRQLGFKQERFSYKVMPLFNRDEQLGYVLFDYVESDNMIYEALRIQLSSAIKGINDYKLLEDSEAALEAEVDKKTEKIQSITYALVSALTTANELNHEVTGRHIKRTGLYAAFIAKKLGCPHTLVRKIELYTPLHDVGKVIVPDHILKKGGKHTPEERKVMEEHVLHGYKILNVKGIDEVARNVALYHHEEWNGGGYPEGRSGNDIPLEARIVAVVDAFEAMTGRAQYDDLKSFDEAFAELERCRNTQFDPQVVDIFFKYKKEIIELGRSFI